MKKDGIGGGNTITGLIYEGKVDLATFLTTQEGYTVIDSYVYYKGDLVARIFKKHGFYEFLKENGVDWTKHISSKLLPLHLVQILYLNIAYVPVNIDDDGNGNCCFSRADPDGKQREEKAFKLARKQETVEHGKIYIH